MEKADDTQIRERLAGLRPGDLGIGTLFWAIRDAIVVGEATTGLVVLWNPAAEHLFGYRPDEIVGRPIEILVPDALKPRHRAGLARYAAGRGGLLAAGAPVELPAVRRDGTTVTVELSLSPLAGGPVPGRFVLAVIRDATERLRTEAERLRRAQAEAARAQAETEQERAALLAAAGELLASSLDVEATLRGLTALAVPRFADWCAVFVREPDGSVRRIEAEYADPAKQGLAAEVTRYGATEDAPLGVANVLRTGRPEFYPEVPDAFWQAIAQGPEHLAVLRRLGFTSLILAPLRARERTLGVVAYATAESGRRYGSDDLALAEELAQRAALALDNALLYREAQVAEAHFRGLFAGVADAILVADAKRRYVDANPAALELLGYAREELLGRRVEDVVAQEPGWTEEEYGRYVAEGRWRGELELRRKDGTTVPVEARATVVEVPDGVLYLSAVRDATERKRAERLRQDFLAMVGHDLRSPLTGIRGHAQLLQRRGEYRAANVEQILAQVDRMRRLLDDLGDAVRLDAGQPDLRPAPVDLVALAREHAAQAQAQARRHRIRVAAPDEPVVGEWDPDRLGQVLQNLLGNAVKYSPEGGDVEVRVEVEAGEARLSVVDQGPGIAPEHLPRLFERFYRAGDSGAGGLGLGLYISRMLVEAHGGRIWAESAPGKGSTFVVALPLA